MRYYVIILFFFVNSMLFSFKAPLFDSLKTEKVKMTWTEEGDYFISDYKLNTYGVIRNYQDMLFYKVDYDGFYIDKNTGNVFQRRWLSHSGNADVGGYSYNLELGNWDVSPTDTSKIIVGEYDSYTGGECRVRSYKNGIVDTLYSWINDNKNYYRHQRGNYYFFALSDSKFLTQYDATNIYGGDKNDRRVSNYINSEKGFITNVGTIYIPNYINLSSIEIDYQNNRIISSTVNIDPYDYSQRYADTYNFFNFENDSLKNPANIRVGGGSWFKSFIDDTLTAYRNIDSLILYNYVKDNVEGSFYIGAKTNVYGLYQDSVHGISTFVLGTDEGKKLLSIHLKTKKVVMDKIITEPYFGKFLTTLTDGSSLSIGEGLFLYKHNLEYLNFDTVTSNFNTSTISDNNIQFNDDSFGPIVEWHWEFGDEETSSLRNPIHKYSQTGTYQVTLKVVNEYGSEHSITKSVTVEEKLKSSFDFGKFSGNAPLTIEFQNYSSSNAKRYIWNFGDGKYSYDKNPTHIFIIPGEYTVSLTVYDDNGNFRTHLSQKKVFVNP